MLYRTLPDRHLVWKTGFEPAPGDTKAPMKWMPRAADGLTASPAKKKADTAVGFLIMQIGRGDRIRTRPRRYQGADEVDAARAADRLTAHPTTKKPT